MSAIGQQQAVAATNAVLFSERAHGSVEAACDAAIRHASRTGQKVYHRGNGLFEVRPCDTRQQQSRLDHIRWVMSLPTF